ncbi:FAD binding domain-containing protein [Ramlibacter albus]|uniref:FAD binding domain-containing protein n=1 Tax=Ramlibacter albus TaxID=2079448 RepID=A0A923S4Z9_9BURK|nr:FAD binding domain-containing protein [Ramlibacter albus]MBC5768139.1 FAD binding domain-containing protein [Ramlibacter albus]
MQALSDFVLYRAASAVEAASLLGGNAGARLLAGGTDLLPNMRRGVLDPSALVSIAAVPELRDLRWLPDGRCSIGAACRLAQLAADEQVAAAFPALVEAVRAVAASGHRSAATVGGNLCQDTRCVFYNQGEWWRAANGGCLKREGTSCHVAPQGNRCHAAFCSDLAPVLLVAGAQVELLGPQGSRTVPLVQLYRDDGAAHLTLQPGELVTRVVLPAAARGAPMVYGKVRGRGGIDFPLAAVAVAARFEGNVLRELKVAVAGTNSLPLLLEGTNALVGAPVDESTSKQLKKLVAQQAGPMRTTAAPSHYRREAACALAQRLLRELAP